MENTTIAICETGERIFNRFGKTIIDCGWRLSRLDGHTGELIQALKSHPLDMVLAADPLADVSAVDLLENLNAEQLTTPLIFIAQTASANRAMAAVRKGAVDYLLIDDDQAILEKTISNYLRLKIKIDSKTPVNGGVGTFISNDPNMLNILDMAKKVAPSAATVLIEGESGTGKEVLARYIHAHSGRDAHPFVAMNCAALPDSLAESELFGYEKGAFTGAGQQRSGKFELGNHGTLLLDEIGEMDLPLQAKLLRVLQEKQVDRVGGQKPIDVDTRVIATTNRNLGQMVQEGQFRKDLFYRLRIIPLVMPPLRARARDIPLLVDHFLKKHSGSSGPLPQFTPEAMQVLERWHWPGNVRELENTVERALLIRSGLHMGPELLLLDENIEGGVTESAARLVGMTVKELEERLIVQTLNHVNQNRTHAAEMLGISIRTLRNKLKEYKDDNWVEAAEG